jgi:hypothetical protein
MRRTEGRRSEASVVRNLGTDSMAQPAAEDRFQSVAPSDSGHELSAMDACIRAVG